MSFALRSLIHSPFTRSVLRSVLVAGGLLGTSLACSVEFLPEVNRSATENICDGSSDCSGGTCRSGFCQTNSTKLPVVLLEVIPPGGAETQEGAPSIAGVPFLSVEEEFALGPSGYELLLGHVGVVRGTVSGEELSSESCLTVSEGQSEPAGLDGSFPVRLTFTPRARLLGLPNPSYTVQGESAPGAVLPKEKHSFAIAIPPGSYDIYGEPLSGVDGCVRPPFLVLNQEIAAADVNLTLKVPPPELFTITVRYPIGAGDLSGFSVDLVERHTGRLLSNSAVLGEGVTRGDNLEYTVDLAFSAVVGDAAAASASELVRLSPPSDVVAATLYVERSVVDLFQDGEGLIDQLKSLPTPVKFGAPVTRLGTTTGVQASVSLVATKLDGSSPGTVAAFSRRVNTDENGFFHVDLLPGTYRLVAEPLDMSLARKEIEFAVSAGAESQVGQTVEIFPRRVISGTAQSFAGKAVYGAPVWVSAAPESFRNVLEMAQGKEAVQPGAEGSATELNGRFRALVDDGIFHLAVRPETSTNFPWRVFLGVQVDGGDVNLGRVVVPLPVVVRGEVKSSDTGDFVRDALIRSYAFLKGGALAQNKDEADAVIQVGQARSDSEGRFELILPSSL